jgi:hypothetical protein
MTTLCVFKIIYYLCDILILDKFKNIMKTLKLSFLLACLLAVTSAFAQTSGTIGNLNWALTGGPTNMTLTITGTGDMPDYAYDGIGPSCPCGVSSS